MLNYVPKWPLCVHILSAIICLACSSFYHLFFVKNEYLRGLLLRLDIGGINILICGSTYSVIFYPFACGEVLFARNCFAVLVTITGLCNFGISFSEKFTKPEYKGLRVVMFGLLIAVCATTFLYLNFVADSD